MQEKDVVINTADGVMPAFVTHPDEGGPFPVIFFYMDAPGIREELRDMARRLGTVGYYVVLPNLYYREGAPVDIMVDRSEETMERMFGLMRTLSNRKIVSDTEGMLSFVAGESAAKDGAVGVVGYCMSGPFVTSVAAAFPDEIASAASIYGAALVTEHSDSPHLRVGDIKGEIYFACAETDHWAPKETIDQLETALKDAGTNHRIEWYPGTEHGFAFPERDVFHKLAGERHWERLFDLFGRTLSG